MRVAVLVSDEVEWALQLASRWAGAGDGVTAVLCDRAVVAARGGHAAAAAVGAALDAGVAVLVEERALARRGVARDRVLDGIKPASLDAIADLLVDAVDKAVWW